MKEIEKARRSEFPFTVVITDPSGNSGIVSSKAKKTKLDIEPEQNGYSVKPLA